MTTQMPTGTRFLFGPFLVDGDAGELRKNGARVRLSGQPVKILLLLLATPGQVVTREQLRQQLWSDGTFVDFEQGLNAAINKLRRALNDSSDHPRYIETVTGRGYRFIGTLEPRNEGHEAGADVISPPGQPGPPTRPASAAAAGGNRLARFAGWRAPAVIGASALVLLAFLARPVPEPHRPWTLTRLTSESGIAADAALSPDGQLIVYSSDRGGTHEPTSLTAGLDLYVKHVAGGPPIRLTFDGAGNRTPDFSPDGSRIVFRSNRDGGGLYEMPSLGGAARLIARGGFDPRYAPDGLHVAYWAGNESVAATVPGSGEIWITSVAGGQPRRIAQGLTTARYPLWDLDGTHVLVLGYAQTKAFDSANDWWVIATDGSTAVRTGAYDTLTRFGLSPTVRDALIPSIPHPSCWSPVDGQVTFSMPTGDSRNVWQLEVSPRTGKVVGQPRRLTTGAGLDDRPSCVNHDAIVFSQVDVSSDVWLIAIDPDRGTATGAPERATHGGRNAYPSPSLAPNGRTLAFTSDQSGQSNVWVRDLRTGDERSVAASPLAQRYPTVNASGDVVAFSVYENAKRSVYVSAPGGVPDRVCEGCLRATDWWHDGKSLVIFGGDPYRIALLDVASHRQTPLVVHPEHQVLYGRLSPDNRWISFTIRLQPTRARIVVAPVDESRPIPEQAWRSIADVDTDDYANWSDDGNILYFTSSQDGYSCLWAQRLDPISRERLGDPFAVQHFHGRLSFEHLGWTAAADRLAVSLIETTGNVWMMSRPGK